MQIQHPKHKMSSRGHGLWMARLTGLASLIFILDLLFLFYAILPLFGGDFRARIWLYMMGPCFALLFAFSIGVRYVQFVYGVKRTLPALRYLIASFFGVWNPCLTIEDGRKKINSDDENSLAKIGGPGYVDIMPGNLVLFERIQGLPLVRGEGRHWISRFESIKEVIKLDEYLGELEDVQAITNDGIKVIVRQVRYRYRLCMGNSHLERTLEDPYPFSEQAVSNMFYNRTITKDGATSWNSTIGFTVDGAISDYINRNTLDDLMTPSQAGKDPRGDICNRLRSESVQARLEQVGAELVWFDIGHFEIPDQAAEQHVNAWQARWIGDAERLRAYGEAQRKSYQELGRAEAQAEILMSIAHAFEDLKMDGDTRQNLRNVFLMRTAHLLEAMSDTQNTFEEKPSR